MITQPLKSYVYESEGERRAFLTHGEPVWVEIERRLEWSWKEFESHPQGKELPVSLKERLWQRLR